MKFLKEVFVISKGLLMFHYSSKRENSESDEAILSSGLLTAIQDFSETTRNGVLDSFSTENEYFIFIRDQKANWVVVGIFDRKARRKLAESLLTKVRDLFRMIELPDIDGLQLAHNKKEQIREEIDTITKQTFGSEQLKSYVMDLLEKRTDIPLAFVVDSEDRKMLAQFARPKPLFKELYVTEFMLVHSTLCKTLSQLGLAENYSYFVINSKEYSVAVCRSGGLLSVTSGAMRTPMKAVLQAAANLCYHDSVDSLTGKGGEFLHHTSALLKADGVIIHNRGVELPSIAGISLSALINNVSEFFRLLNRREFTQLQVVVKEKETTKLSLKRNGSQEFEIKLFKRS